jgi:hypothetical protein
MAPHSATAGPNIFKALSKVRVKMTEENDDKDPRVASNASRSRSLRFADKETLIFEAVANNIIKPSLGDHVVESSNNNVVVVRNRGVA